MELFAALEAGFILWLIRVLRLFSSVLSSFNLLSVVSCWPSIVFGMSSLRPRTSSFMRLDSSSRLRLALLSSPMTLSTSDNAVSRRSVRASSEILRVSVSLESWSRRAKAFSKEASISALSCSIWGGVGGAIKG